METTLQMLKTHPSPSQIDLEHLARAITELQICAQACTTCADACLGEKEVQSLIDCIRINLDCADICTATGAMLSRVNSASTEYFQIIVEACVKICRLCATECEKHGSKHEHCRICAEACSRCENACREILS